MNMKKLMQMGSKALRLQMKKYPDKRFKDDDSTPVSFADLADQMDAILAVMYESPGFEVYMPSPGVWIVRYPKKGSGRNVRND